jgi:hypothetical protein
MKVICGYDLNHSPTVSFWDIIFNENAYEMYAKHWLK